MTQHTNECLSRDAYVPNEGTCTCGAANKIQESGIPGIEIPTDSPHSAAMAERERCAKIASDEKYEDETGPQEAAWNSACDHIADRIRGHG